MKTTAKIFFLIIFTLLFSTNAHAQTGYSGSIWDSDTPPAPWEHGAMIYATNCTADGTPLLSKHYGTTEVLAGTSTFSASWITTPDPGDFVCLYVIFQHGGVDQPGDTVTHSIGYANFIPGNMNFGSIRTGTGPNSIQLVDFSATQQSSNNTWLPYILLVGSVALVSGTVAVIRKRKI